MAQKLPLPRARLSYASPGDPAMQRLVINTMEWLTGRHRLERLYAEIKQEAPPPAEVWGALLDKLRVTIDYDKARLARVPATGPVVFLANHPFGVLDGLILGYLIGQVRPEFFVLVNEVLCREKILAPFLLPVDFRETKPALHTNLQTRRQALSCLRQGGALGIFPAGGVATAPRLGTKAHDLEWKRFVAKLVQQSQATVVPIYFQGENSWLFQLASQFSQNLRLSLLLYEVRNKMGSTLSVTIGDTVPYSQLAGIRDRQELLDHLRSLTFSLKPA